MGYWKEAKKELKRERKSSLYPVVYVAQSLKEYEQELMQKEVDSLQELGLVNSSFHEVLREAENFYVQLQNFGQSFSNINQASSQFEGVKGEIAQSVGKAQKGVEALKNSSRQVESHFDQIEHTFGDFLEAVKKIKKCTSKIITIADQTNILALNATIESARAGEQGKGFAVVAEEIRKLAEQSNTSAVEIQEVLGQLKNNSDISVSTMEQVQEIIQVQAEKLVQTNHAFETVGSGIEQSVQGIGKIMEEMSSLNGARSHTVAEVQNVASLAQQNAASIEETAASIDEVAHLISAMAGRMDNLRQASDTLKEKASVFQL